MPINDPDEIIEIETELKKMDQRQFEYAKKY